MPSTGHESTSPGRIAEQPADKYTCQQLKRFSVLFNLITEHGHTHATGASPAAAQLAAGNGTDLHSRLIYKLVCDDVAVICYNAARSHSKRVRPHVPVFTPVLNGIPAAHFNKCNFVNPEGALKNLCCSVSRAGNIDTADPSRSNLIDIKPLKNKDRTL